MSGRELNVLFLPRYPREGASSRYRVYQYLPHLERLGVNCTVQPFMDSAMYAVQFSPGNFPAKLWHSAKAVLRRLRALARYKQYDLIYLQRELLPFGPPVIERCLRHRGSVLVFDYDDALFIGKPSRYNPLATRLRSPLKTLELFRIADCVVAGNDWLRDNAAATGAQAVTVEVAEDTARIAMHAPHSNARPVTVGWLGSTSTVKYLHLIAPALRRIGRDYPQVRFELMGGGDFHMDGVAWQQAPWTLDGELQALARFDIGLMPLPEEDWALGKSGGKARTYMAAGVVPVCTRIGYNRELIREGETGCLCSTEQEWYLALAALIEDAALRQRMAEQARTDVARRFSPAAQARKLRDVFDAALARRRTRAGATGAAPPT